MQMTMIAENVPPSGAEAARAISWLQDVKFRSEFSDRPPRGFPRSLPGMTLLGGVARVSTLIALAAFTSACRETRPGSLDAVHAVGDQSRAGSVYLIRGWMGVFSGGLATLGNDFTAHGVRAAVY